MRILIAFDDSHHARLALSVVVARRWPHGTSVRLVSVLDRSAGRRRVDRAGISQSLSAAAGELASLLSGAEIDTALFEGDAADAIAEEAERWQSSLIVAGCRGTTGLENLLLGSVSRAILEKAPCPVLIARPVPEDARGNVIVALDDSEHSAGAVEWLAEQPWADWCKIGVISAVDAAPVDYTGHLNISKASRALLEWKNRRYMQEYALKQWAKFLKRKLPNASLYFGLLEGDPGTVILDSARDCPAELIVMGSHGRSGISRLLLGSVSQHIASSAPCSVEVVRGHRSSLYAPLRNFIEKHNTLPRILSRRPARKLTGDYTPQAQGGVIGML